MSLARHLPRFRKATQMLPALAERESWSRERIDAFQLEQINKVWSHATRHVPYYRTLAARLSLPHCFATLAEYRERVPLLRKQDLKAQKADFLSESPEPGGWVRTGGSTGEPMLVFWSHRAHREMLWRKYRMEQAWGVDFFDRKAFLWGHAASFSPGLTGVWQRRSQAVQDRLRNRVRLNAYRLGDEDLSRYAEEIRRRRVRCVYGYSSAVTLLSQKAGQMGRDLPDLKLAILTAEPATESMLAACRAGFNAGAAVEYGSVECGVIATGMPDASLRVCEDRVLLECLARTDGCFDLVVSVLNNPSFPLLRYVIEDCVESAAAFDDTGFARLGQIVGRRGDALIARSGRRVHSLAVKHALESLEGVRRFKAHQDADGSVAITLEAESLPPRRVLEPAAATLSDVLEGFPVSVSMVEHLQGNRAGKHRWVSSDRGRGDHADCAGGEDARR
ncbi:MAG: hypothetical protein AAGJ46_17485 [Planctomycetota bacterium]